LGVDLKLNSDYFPTQHLLTGFLLESFALHCRLTVGQFCGHFNHGYERLEYAIHPQGRRHFCPEDGDDNFLRNVDNE
jgi:hypothetical protein